MALAQVKNNILLLHSRLYYSFVVGENLGSIIQSDCGCVEEACQKECAGWGPWNDWGQWMPSCLDNAGGAEDTLFDDFEIHRPKRFRSRDCFVKDKGVLTTETIPISDTNGECLFAEKFETEFLQDPPQCEVVVLPDGEIETKVRIRNIT